LTLAERGELSNPATLQKETKRMLADQAGDGRAGERFSRLNG